MDASTYWKIKDFERLHSIATAQSPSLSVIFWPHFCFLLVGPVRPWNIEDWAPLISFRSKGHFKSDFFIKSVNFWQLLIQSWWHTVDVLSPLPGSWDPSIFEMFAFNQHTSAWNIELEKLHLFLGMGTFRSFSEKHTVLKFRAFRYKITSFFAAGRVS